MSTQAERELEELKNDLAALQQKSLSAKSTGQDKVIMASLEKQIEAKEAEIASASASARGVGIFGKQLKSRSLSATNLAASAASAAPATASGVNNPPSPTLTPRAPTGIATPATAPPMLHFVVGPNNHITFYNQNGSALKPGNWDQIGTLATALVVARTDAKMRSLVLALQDGGPRASRHAAQYLQNAMLRMNASRAEELIQATTVELLTHMLGDFCRLHEYNVTHKKNPRIASITGDSYVSEEGAKRSRKAYREAAKAAPFREDVMKVQEDEDFRSQM